ncbi:hypothetical protein BV20DRAFT_960790 [Pilatotrama ljubarskyi]|nr:hypothetical protein BV20DRAFT_960790 [Pilatotrama ljubarskyi]
MRCTLSCIATTACPRSLDHDRRSAFHAAIRPRSLAPLELPSQYHHDGRTMGDPLRDADEMQRVEAPVPVRVAGATRVQAPDPARPPRPHKKRVSRALATAARI